MRSRELPPGEIQLWRVLHHVADAQHDDLERHLTADEIVLRDRFGAERARKFTITRGTLRVLLSRYTGIAPRDIRFRYGPRGKPYLLEKGRQDNPRLQFNLSDSDDVVVFGFASDREIGVDIERVRHVERWRRIAERFFGSSAAEELGTLPESERDREFSSRWVMEEARIKATGQGIWSRSSPDAGLLSYKSFSPLPDYCGAVAAPGRDWIICLTSLPA